jgi:hypothetical protein
MAFSPGAVSIEFEECLLLASGSRRDRLGLSGVRELKEAGIESKVALDLDVES